MSQASKPASWEVFTTPSTDNVQYYPILKKKREFFQLLKKNDTKIFKNGYSHYCCVVPQSYSTNMNSEYEIFISFFDESPHISFIGFCVKVCKDTFSQETNLLLLFLMKSGKAICYLMKDNFINVKCNITDAWELFYHLYEEYLRRFIVTVIGTQFFYSILYSQFMQKEKLLLQLLYKGSKIVRISKKSVFYKIHRKRKLSVTDLVYTTHNMPKSKKCAFSCFRFKKLPVKRCGRFFHNISRESTFGCTKHSLKGEFNLISHLDASKSFDLSEDISSLSSQTHSEFSDSKTVFNPHNKQIPLKRKFEEIERNGKDIVSSHTSSKCSNFSESNIKTNYVGKWEKYTNFKPCTIESYSDIPSIKQLVPYFLSDQSKHGISTNSSVLNVHSVPVQSKILTSASLIKRMNITESALAVKSLHEVANSGSQNYKDPGLTYSDQVFSKDGEFTVHASKDNNDHFPKFTASKVHSSELPISAPFTEDFSYTSEIIPSSAALETFTDNPNDVDFATAGGRNINVSNTAMLAAQKLMKDVFSDEKTKIFERSNDSISNRSGKYDTSNIFKNVGCSSKEMISCEISDTDMDGTLVEKLFEDIPFDEKDFEQVECIEVANTNVDSKANVSHIPNRKPRKSLGGRRNMKYSEKL